MQYLYMNASKFDFETYKIKSCLVIIETEQGEVWRALTYNTEYPTSRNTYSNWRKGNAYTLD